MHILIIFGPPGSGKGTQAENLSKNNNYTHLSTGQLLREEISKKTSIGVEVENLLAKGQFAPDNMMFEIIKKFLDKNKDKKILLDGFPRNLTQARFLLEQLKSEEIVILNIEADEKELLRRLLLRAQKQNRHDDKEEVIKERFKIYREQTFPIISFLEKQGKRIIHIDGMKTVEEVSQDISKKLDSNI